MQRTRRSRTLKQYGSRRKSVMNTANKVVSALNTGVRFRNLAKGARNAYKRYQSSGSVVKAVLGSGSGGDYSQFTAAKMNTGRKKKTTLAALTREVHNKSETVIYRFNGMNNFNDNGYYWCGKNLLAAASRTDLPLYMVDLTSVNNTGIGGIQIYGQPTYRCSVSTTGVIGWSICNSTTNDGTTTVSTWVPEKIPSFSTSVNNPHEKSKLLWTDVRLNLWGAKNKAVKYTVQVVKLLDDALDPQLSDDTLSGPPYARKNAFYQGLIKPYVYNPLAQTSQSLIQKGLKVLKTYETIIQPTSSTESDIDPHVKVLKWFMRWDREFNYKETAVKLTTATDLCEQADYANQQVECLCYTKPKAKLWLMIRASAYQSQSDATVDNTVSPSFDMCVRTCHVPN